WPGLDSTFWRNVRLRTGPSAPAGARLGLALSVLPTFATDLGVVLRAVARFRRLAAQATDLSQVVEAAILNRLPALAADLPEEFGPVLRLHRLSAFGRFAGAPAAGCAFAWICSHAVFFPHKADVPNLPRRSASPKDVISRAPLPACNSILCSVYKCNGTRVTLTYEPPRGSSVTLIDEPPRGVNGAWRVRVAAAAALLLQRRRIGLHGTTER